MNDPSCVEPPRSAGACHRASQWPDPLDQPDGKLRTQGHMFHLPGGESVMVRVISPQDRDRLQAYMRNLSGSTRRNRFLGAVSELAPTELDRLAHMDLPGELALIAFARMVGETHMVGEAIHVIAPESRRCEIALSVTDVGSEKAWARCCFGTWNAGRDFWAPAILSAKSYEPTTP